MMITKNSNEIPNNASNSCVSIDGAGSNSCNINSIGQQQKQKQGHIHRYRRKKTPDRRLFEAIVEENYPKVERFLREGANPNRKYDGVCAFHIALGLEEQEEGEKSMKMMISECERVRLFLDFNADVNIKSDKELWTPLHVCAYRNKPASIQLLLSLSENSIDPDQVDSQNRSPLDLALEQDNYECVEILDNFLSFHFNDKNREEKKNATNCGWEYTSDGQQQHRTLKTTSNRQIKPTSSRLASLLTEDYSDEEEDFFNDNPNKIKTDQKDDNFIGNDVNNVDLASFKTSTFDEEKLKHLFTQLHLSDSDNQDENENYNNNKRATILMTDDETTTMENNRTVIDINEELDLTKVSRSILNSNSNKSNKNNDQDETSASFLTALLNPKSSPSHLLANDKIEEGIITASKINCYPALPSPKTITFRQQKKKKEKQQQTVTIDLDKEIDEIYAQINPKKNAKKKALCSPTPTATPTLATRTLTNINTMTMELKSRKGYSDQLCQELCDKMMNTTSTSDVVEARMFKCFMESCIDRLSGKEWREGMQKSSFNYLLIDSRISQNLPLRAKKNKNHDSEKQMMDQKEVFSQFIDSIFYVGKGKRDRPYEHLTESLKFWKSHREGKKLPSEVLVSPSKTAARYLSSTSAAKQKLVKLSQKVSRIVDIWKADSGVVSLHCFQSCIGTEAYTREAAMIDALSKKNLTNKQRGTYYGEAKQWSQEKQCELGTILLRRACAIYMAEGERQIRPEDL